MRVLVTVVGFGDTDPLLPIGWVKWWTAVGRRIDLFDLGRWLSWLGSGRVVRAVLMSIEPGGRLKMVVLRSDRL